MLSLNRCTQELQGQGSVEKKILLLSEPQDSRFCGGLRGRLLAARKTLGKNPSVKQSYGCRLGGTDQERGGQPKSVTAHQSTDKDGQKIAQE